MITFIIPCLNEAPNITLILKNISIIKKYKYLLVDGGSTDHSKKLYIKHKINFISTLPSRGLQQKKGAEKSITKWLFFLHADTELSQVNIEQIEKFVRSNKNKVAFFNLIYDEKHFLPIMISIWANFRSVIFGLPFGDQGLLIKRNYYFNLGGHSKISIMEDLEFILKVPYKNRTLMKSKVKTSFRRYKKKGVILQGSIHIICQFMFLLRFNKKLILMIYKYFEK